MKVIAGEMVLRRITASSAAAVEVMHVPSRQADGTRSIPIRNFAISAQEFHRRFGNRRHLGMVATRLADKAHAIHQAEQRTRCDGNVYMVRDRAIGLSQA